MRKAALVVAVAAATASAQGIHHVDLSLRPMLGNSISLVVATPSVAWGTVTPGQSNAAPPLQAVSVVSSWTLSPGNTVKLYAYLDSAAAAMTGTLTGSQIPAAAFTGSVNGGAAQSFSAANPFGGAALSVVLYSQTLTSLTAVGGRTDSISLTMNLTGVTGLGADNYIGTMHLQAQAL